jgi:hypothetical protein
MRRGRGGFSSASRTGSPSPLKVAWFRGRGSRQTVASYLSGTIVKERCGNDEKVGG